MLCDIKLTLKELQSHKSTEKEEGESRKEIYAISEESNEFKGKKTGRFK